MVAFLYGTISTRESDCHISTGFFLWLSRYTPLTEYRTDRANGGVGLVIGSHWPFGYETLKTVRFTFKKDAEKLNGPVRFRPTNARHGFVLELLKSKATDCEVG